MELKRVKSGIPGFDELIEGGFPKNSNILISGQPGTGKTIFGLQFLHEGVKEGEPGVYITFEQDINDLVTQSDKFGWNLKKYLDDGSLSLFSLDVKEFKMLDFVKEVKKKKATRLVIDSLSSILSHPIAWEEIDTYYMLTDKLERLVPSPKYNPVVATRILIHAIMENLKEVSCTSLLTSELVGGSKGFSRDTISEFVVDGLIILDYNIVGGKYSRSLVIQKLRATNHSQHIHPLDIREGEGLVVLDL